MRRDRYGKPMLCPVCFKGRIIVNVNEYLSQALANI